MKKRIFLLTIVFLILTLSSCSNKEDIKIGFVGTITGRFSDLGVAGRNGVILKVEETNQAGGIDSRDIELLIRNDAGSKEKALEAVKELEAEGVDAIIGPSLSNNVLYVLDYINKSQILTMGATITSSQLSRKDDYFFRVSQENITESKLHAKFLIDNDQDEVVILVDTSNEAFSVKWYEEFKKEYTALEGRILRKISYNSDNEIKYSQLAEKIITEGADGLLTITSAMDTAMIAQHLNIRDYKPFFMTSNWAMTNELIRQGGRAVEGIYTSHIVDYKRRNQKFKEFASNYEDRFGEKPTFAADYNYDAASVLFKAIKEADNINSDSIKAELLDIERFTGVLGEFVFDQYGDVDRDYIIFKVSDREFVEFKKD